MQNHDYMAWLGNSASVATIAGTILGLLPPLAALAAIVWYLLQMYESKTFREWNDARLKRKKQRKIAKLQAQQKVITAELEALEVKQALKAFTDHMARTADEKVQSAAQEARAEAAKIEEKK